MRGEVCVLHCGAVSGDQLAADLPGELQRCLDVGATEVVIDLDPWSPLDKRGLDALRSAATAFAEEGGALVMAVEEPEARAALAAAGLMRAVPPAPEALDDHDVEGPVRLADRPRWEHEFTFPATPRQLRAARRRVTAFAEIAGLSGTDLFELSVAVAEGLANAVVHGSPHGADDDISVRFFCYEDEVAVEISDSGQGMDIMPICAPATSETSGRGIHFMRALTDTLLYTCGPLGTHVLLVKHRT
jgi:anti-sigma regulatory factor (Ser/Thr protein kinase)